MNAFSYMNINGNGYEVTIGGTLLTVEITGHAAWRKVGRSIEEQAIYMSVQKGFEHIKTLINGERFILVDSEFLCSIIGQVHFYSGEVVVDIITVVDSMEPTNPKGTAEFYI